MLISYDDKRNQSRFGLVWFYLMRYQHCTLFNAISFLYIYVKYMRYGLLCFDGISTIVGYLMPKPLYTYILKFMIWFRLVYGLVYQSL